MFAVRALITGLLALAATARAEPLFATLLAVPTAPTRANLAPSHTSADQAAPIDTVTTFHWSPLSINVAAPAVTSEPAPDAGIGTIPPPPGSRSLALSGLAAAAGIHVIRRLQQVTGRALPPDWYAAGRPPQLGHITPLPPDLESAAWPVVPAILLAFDPARASHATSWRVHPEPEKKPSTPLPSPAAPRGPPRIPATPRTA